MERRGGAGPLTPLALQAARGPAAPLGALSPAVAAGRAEPVTARTGRPLLRHFLPARRLPDGTRSQVFSPPASLSVWEPEGGRDGPGAAPRARECSPAPFPGLAARRWPRPRPLLATPGGDPGGPRLESTWVWPRRVRVRGERGRVVPRARAASSPTSARPGAVSAWEVGVCIGPGSRLS